MFVYTEMKGDLLKMDKNTRKVGRPPSDKAYRKNVLRVSKVEDWLESVIDRVPQNSKAKSILVEELELFINQETQKAIRRCGKVDR